MENLIGIKLYVKKFLCLVSSYLLKELITVDTVGNIRVNIFDDTVSVVMV